MPIVTDELDTAAIEQAADLLASCSHAVALAGAGMSKESGIPTFRGAGGLWTTRGEPPLNQFETFSMDPGRWWERRLEEAQQPNEFSEAIELAAPNPGHEALVELEQLGILRHLITQNIDDLHIRAGHLSITEIHGNRNWMRCMSCGERWPREQVSIDPEQLPPRCTEEGCSGIVKSDTVMFGEPIPTAALQRCSLETAMADVFLTLGTSAVVYPAAGYPQEARRRNVPLIEVNPEETPLTPISDIVIRAESGVALPAIVEGVRRRLGEDAT